VPEGGALFAFLGAMRAFGKAKKQQQWFAKRSATRLKLKTENRKESAEKHYKKMGRQDK